MNGLDYFIIMLIGGMALIAATRGILREVVGLVSLMVSVFVAFSFSDTIHPIFATYLGHPFWASLAAFGALFVGSLFACGFLGRFLQFAANVAGLTHLDRGLGFLFGMTKGSVLVLVGFALFLAANVKTPTLVSQSLLSPYCIEVAHGAGRMLSPQSPIAKWLQGGYQNYHATAGRVPLWKTEVAATAKNEDLDGLMGDLQLGDQASLDPPSSPVVEEDLTALLSEMQGGKDIADLAKALPELEKIQGGVNQARRAESWLNARLKTMNRESAGLLGWLLGAPEPASANGVKKEHRSDWEGAVDNQPSSGNLPRIEKAEAIDALLGQLDREVN